MTDDDLTKLEKKLKIKLPEQYREVLKTLGARFREYECFQEFDASFYVNPLDVIRINAQERLKDSGTVEAFPEWWKIFVLVGTNGAGGYYCVRLDNRPGLWMIGSDCGDVPSKLGSLKKHVNEIAKAYRQEQKEITRRNAGRTEDEIEEDKAAAAAKNPDAISWQAAESPKYMVRDFPEIGRQVSPRKLRLWGIASLRRMKDLPKDPDCAKALAMAEKLVAGTVPLEAQKELRDLLDKKGDDVMYGRQQSAAGLRGVRAVWNLLQDEKDYLRNKPSGNTKPDLTTVWYFVVSASQDPLEDEIQARLLREVLGNPFNPVVFDKQWRTKTVLGLAQQIYDNESFERMPELAKVIREAGCDNQRILKHLQRKAGHFRGCWVLDALLELDAKLKGKRSKSNA